MYSGISDSFIEVLVFAAMRCGIRAQRLGAADNLHDLGRDRVLAGPVHATRVLENQVLGVVGFSFHRPLASGLLGGGGIVKRRVEPWVGVTRLQRVEDPLGAGLAFG